MAFRASVRAFVNNTEHRADSSFHSRDFHSFFLCAIAIAVGHGAMGVYCADVWAMVIQPRDI